MSYLLKDYLSNVYSGLGTCTYTVPVAGNYLVNCQSTVNPPSGLSIVINQNGSPIATSSALSPAEQTAFVSGNMQCAMNDIITVVLSSSQASDSIPGVIKSTISLTLQGA